MNLDNDADLESALRQALSRIEPGRDFSAISYARPRVVYWPPSRMMLAIAAGLVLLLLLPIGMLQYQARQRRGEKAREQLMMALKITERKLQKTRQMVARELNRRNNL